MMGWFGVVFKEDISNVSEYLVIALTTGYLGSLTTFSGWNQKMLELSVDGKWLFSVLGFLIGNVKKDMFWCYGSLIQNFCLLCFSLHIHCILVSAWMNCYDELVKN